MEVHPRRRVLVVQPVRHLPQGFRQVPDGLVDLLLIEQRHAQVVMRPGVRADRVPGSSGDGLSPPAGAFLTLYSRKPELLVRLDVVRIELQGVVVLGNGVVGLALAVELVAGADEGVIVEELLADLRDGVGSGVDEFRDVGRPVGRPSGATSSTGGLAWPFSSMCVRHSCV